MGAEIDKVPEKARVVKGLSGMLIGRDHLGLFSELLPEIFKELDDEETTRVVSRMGGDAVGLAEMANKLPPEQNNSG